MKLTKNSKIDSSYFFKFCLVLILIGYSSTANIRSFDLASCIMKIENARELKISGGQMDKPSWDTECDQSVTVDFEARDKMEEYKQCNSVNSWGPQPNIYPPVDPKIIPAKCNLILWQQKRIVALIDKFTKKGWNYCHHHSPSWPTPSNGRIAINPSNIAGDGGSDGVCSKAGINGEKGWNGIDCTHFTSWIYNYGFGAHLATLTGDQACGPNAPGKAIQIKIDQINYSNAELAKLLPGDLLYIAKKSSASPLSVSHGILWTGMKLQPTGPFSEEALLKNLPENQKKAVKSDVDAFKKSGLDIYVIADTHFAGPNYRIFAGWWRKAFTHARRLIGEKVETSPANMKFNGKVCEVTKS